MQIMKKICHNSNLKNIMCKRYKSAIVANNLESPKFERVKSFDEIPSLRPVPILGASWAFLPIIGKYNPLQMDQANMQLYKEYGSIVRLDMPMSLQIVHLFDVNDIEKVLRHEGKIPFREPFESLKYFRKSKKEFFTGGGLLASNGKEWYNLRSKVQAHLLKPKSIQSYLHGLDGVALEMVDKIDRLRGDTDEVTDLMPELYKWALESISLIALETKFNCLDDNLSTDSDAYQMIKSVNSIFRLWYILEFSPFKLWKYFPSKIHKKFVLNMTKFSEISYKCIYEAKARMDANRDLERPPTLMETFFYKENMDYRDATTMVADMILGGIDTTSHSVAFALYHLAKNQDAQDKAYHEIQGICPNSDAVLSVEHLNEARYIKACVKEAMRLNPIVSTIPRRLEQDIVLSGYNVPAGSLILIQTLITSRLEKYFDDATQFKPERWLRGESSTKINKFASLPFSMGTRSCIGRRIAEQEMWTLLIRILQRYKVEYHHENIGAKTRIVNTPDKPLRFKFIDRT